MAYGATPVFRVVVVASGVTNYFTTPVYGNFEKSNRATGTVFWMLEEWVLLTIKVYGLAISK